MPRRANAPARPSSTSFCAKTVSDAGVAGPRRPACGLAKCPMKDFLRQQLERYVARLEELDFLLSREDIMGDMAQYRTLSREHAEVTQVAGRYQRYRQCESDLATAREMLADPDMAEMAQEEITSASEELLRLESELQRLLLPKDPDDARNAFLEVRAGTGGDESALFAG